MDDREEERAVGPSLVPDRGRRGSFVRVELVALQQPREVRFAGGGIFITDRRTEGFGRLQMVLSIAPDAMLGWREAEILWEDRVVRVASFFEVLEGGSSGAGSGPRGIGSHLI